MRLFKERFEAICTLITAVCLGLPRDQALELREDIPKTVSKLSKLGMSISKRYAIEARTPGHYTAFNDRTKVLCTHAREIGRQIGLKVETVGPNNEGRGLTASIGDVTIELK